MLGKDYNSMFNNFPKEEDEKLDNPIPNNDLNSQPPQPIPPLQETNVSEEKTLIEIPQAYYDKLAKEQLETKQAEEVAIQKHEEKVAVSNDFSRMLFLGVLCAIITYLSLHYTINKNELFIFLIPVYIVVGTIIFAIKNKKDSPFPSSIMMGGMIVAVITFAISMVQEDKMDMWTYYTVAGAIVAFVGLIVSNIITKLITDIKNVKALETVGYIIFFGALIAVPAFLYTNYRDDFYKFVFQKQTVVQAETEEEFVLKTLKNRYGLTFTCDDSKTKHSLTKENRKVVTRLCSDEYGNKMEVNSIAYNEGSTEYVVLDSYMDTMIMIPSKTEISNNLLSVTAADEVKVSLYPIKNCTFYGDCVDCDEYYEIYQEENDIEKQFKVSTELNLKKNLTLNKKDYLNNNEYKYIIEVQDQYNLLEADYPSMVENILNALNTKGYKNTYGYEIKIVHKYESSDDGLMKTVYHVIGKTNSDKTFKDPVPVELN